MSELDQVYHALVDASNALDDYAHLDFVSEKRFDEAARLSRDIDTIMRTLQGWMDLEQRSLEEVR